MSLGSVLLTVAPILIGLAGLVYALRVARVQATRRAEQRRLRALSAVRESQFALMKAMRDNQVAVAEHHVFDREEPGNWPAVDEDSPNEAVGDSRTSIAVGRSSNSSLRLLELLLPTLPAKDVLRLAGLIDGGPRRKGHLALVDDEMDALDALRDVRRALPQLTLEEQDRLIEALDALTRDPNPGAEAIAVMRTDRIRRD